MPFAVVIPKRKTRARLTPCAGRKESRCTMTDKRRTRVVQAKTRVAKLLHRIDTDLRYTAKAKATLARPSSSGMVNLRMRDLKRLFASRWGATLPDDDAGRGDLEIAAHHLAHCRTKPRDRIIEFAALYAPWMATDAAAMMADDIIEQPRGWSVDELGEELRLTDEERTALGIGTIGAIDMDKAEREERRRLRHVERSRRGRAARSIGRPGGRPRKTPCAPKSLTTSAAHGVNAALRSDAAVIPARP